MAKGEEAMDRQDFLVPFLLGFPPNLRPVDFLSRLLEHTINTLAFFLFPLLSFEVIQKSFEKVLCLTSAFQNV